MPIGVEISVDELDLARLRPGPIMRAATRAMRKAGATALRDMRSEAGKRIRGRKRIKAKAVRDAMRMRRPKGGTLESLEWAVDVSGKPVPLAAYPHRQTKRGVSVSVNRGKRTLVKGAFVATMRSGHRGVFRRQGADRLPIRELLGSRPVDALLHEGEAKAVAERGRVSLVRTFTALLPVELEKERR